MIDLHSDDISFIYRLQLLNTCTVPGHCPLYLARYRGRQLHFNKSNIVLTISMPNIVKQFTCRIVLLLLKNICFYEIILYFKIPDSNQDIKHLQSTFRVQMNGQRVIVKQHKIQHNNILTINIPNKLTPPKVGITSPLRIEKRVVLPAPLCPSRATH